MTAETYPELALHPRPLAGVAYPHPSLEDSYEPGTTESYIAQLVSALLVASGGSTVLETGGFRGTTSAWLALALERMGGGELTVCDIEPDRCDAILARLNGLGRTEEILPNTKYRVLQGDVLYVVAQCTPDKYYDFVWLDDDHEEFHVRSEISALWPKMKPGGLIVGHDVFGSVNLQKVFKFYGGYAINLPRLGPAGGIGIIQIPA